MCRIAQYELDKIFNSFFFFKNGLPAPFYEGIKGLSQGPPDA